MGLFRDLGQFLSPTLSNLKERWLKFTSVGFSLNLKILKVKKKTTTKKQGKIVASTVI